MMARENWRRQAGDMRGHKKAKEKDKICKELNRK